MKRLLLAVACAIVATPALAQQGGTSDYPGTVPWQFRSPDERVARLATAQTILAVKGGAYDGGAAGAAGGPGGGFGGAGGTATAVNNLIQVTQNVTCTASAPGAQVVCTGGTVDINATQDSRGASSDATTNLTGNTTNNTGNTVNNGGGD